MIIWQGRGFLVAVIVFGFSLLLNLTFNATYGEGYYDHHKWPFALSLVGSAILCRVLGNNFRKKSDRVVIDKLTGKEFVINQSRHTLFFIPMQHWGPILLACAAILFGIELRH